MNKIQDDFHIKLINDLTNVIKRNVEAFSVISEENSHFFQITSIHTLIVFALIQANAIDKAECLGTDYTYSAVYNSIKSTKFLEKMLKSNESK